MPIVRRNFLLSGLLMAASLAAWPQISTAAAAVCPKGEVSTTALTLAVELLDSESERLRVITQAVLEQVPVPESDDKQIIIEMLEGTVRAAYKEYQAEPEPSPLLLKRSLSTRLPHFCRLALPAASVAEAAETAAPSAAAVTPRTRQVETDAATTVSDRLVQMVSKASDSTLPEPSDGSEDGATPNRVAELAAYSQSATTARNELKELESKHRDLFACDQNDPEDCYPDRFRDELEVECSGLSEGSDQRLRCSQAMERLMRSRFNEIVEAEKAATTLSKDAPETRVISNLRRSIEPTYRRVVNFEARRNANYGIYAGPSLLLQDDGSWDGGSEVLARFETETFPSRDSKACWFGQSCRAVTEISFVTAGTEFPSEVEDPNALPVNPLDEDGEFHMRWLLRHRFTNWVGLEYGFGITSPIEDSNPFARVEPRAQLGLHLQTVYTDGVLGELSMGYAHDRSWEYFSGMDDPATMDIDERTVEREFDRLYLEGLLLFPNLSLGGWRLAARIGADWPVDGDQTAEIRTSILFYYPFNDWLDGYKPSIAASESP